MSDSAAPKSNTRSLRWITDPRTWTIILTLTFAGTLVYQQSFNPRRCFDAGIKALERNRIEDVKKSVKSLENIPSFRAHHDYLKGWVELQSGNPKQALELALTAKDHPDIEVDARILAGQASYSMGAAGNAKLHWEDALALQPDSLTAHRWLGALYFDIGAMDNALIHLTTVSRLAPSDYRPDRFMGLINKDYERPELAIPHYIESLRRAPNQPEAEKVWMELAECQIKQHEYDAALKSLSNCPPSVRHSRLMARCYMNTGKLEEARQFAKNALAEQKSDLDTLQLNAEIALVDGDTNTAVELLRQGVALNPFNYGVRTQYAQVLGRLGNKTAYEEQNKIVEDLKVRWQKFSDLQIDAINRPTDAMIRYEIGILAQQLGMPKLAATWYKAALSINPGMGIASQALNSLDVAQREPDGKRVDGTN
jgi:tetratricopeptide (TPR) repeat protein